MYAVVKTGGKQHKVVVGETVSVELLDADAGSVVTLPVLLVNDGEKLLTGKEAAAATVTAEVLGHGKADKIIVFKLKKRKGYKRTRGHRQGLTLIRVTEIDFEGAKKPSKVKAAEVAVEKKPVAKKVEPATAKSPATKSAAERPRAAKAEAKKAASKKPEPTPAAKKPAAKKPAAKKPAAKKPAAKKPAAKKPAAKKPAAKKPAAKKTTDPAESAE
jgi:large subunit ribosomal protein L21